MDRTLTDFQRSLQAAVDDLFKSVSMPITWKLDGEKETFCYGSAENGRVQIWIYDDEAECRFGEFHRLCERADFDSPGQLKDYFIETVRARMAADGRG